MEDKHLLHLHKAFQISAAVLDLFTGKNQNEIERFVFCGVQKLNKIVLGLLRLYPDVDGSPDLEFTMGISIRSLMMDDILVLGIINEVYDGTLNGVNKSGLTGKVKDLCYKYISDGTRQLIEQVLNSAEPDESRRIDIAKRFAMTFLRAFSIPTDGTKPTLNPGFRFTLAEVYKGLSDSENARKEAVYDLYSFYSKYDHLSHWTGLANEISFESRKHRIHFATVLILMHLRDLLAIAYDFVPGYDDLLPHMENLHNYIPSSYFSEQQDHTATAS